METQRGEGTSARMKTCEKRQPEALRKKSRIRVAGEEKSPARNRPAGTALGTQSKKKASERSWTEKTWE